MTTTLASRTSAPTARHTGSVKSGGWWSKCLSTNPVKSGGWWSKCLRGPRAPSGAHRWRDTASSQLPGESCRHCGSQLDCASNNHPRLSQLDCASNNHPRLAFSSTAHQTKPPPPQPARLRIKQNHPRLAFSAGVTLSTTPARRLGVATSRGRVRTSRTGSLSDTTPKPGSEEH
jgi:hypothetical protein